MIANKRDVAKCLKTLNVMLQSLKDQQVTITLRNDSIVRGTITSVDADMNIELRDATLAPDHFYLTDTPQEPRKLTDNEEVAASGDLSAAAIGEEVEGDTCDSDSSCEDLVNDDETIYSYFVVKGSRVRHIDLPSDLDLASATRSEITRVRNRRKHWTKRDIVQPYKRGDSPTKNVTNSSKETSSFQ